MQGLIDKNAEIARKQKEQEKLQHDHAAIEKKLANANFVEKAPANVVENQRQKLSDLKVSIEKVQEQLEKLNRL